jgi:hypothetical protein
VEVLEQRAESHQSTPCSNSRQVVALVVEVEVAIQDRVAE